MFSKIYKELIQMYVKYVGQQTLSCAKCLDNATLLTLKSWPTNISCTTCLDNATLLTLNRQLSSSSIWRTICYKWSLVTHCHQFYSTNIVGARPKPGPGFPKADVMIFFLCSMVCGEMRLFVLLILVELFSQ